jgi:outer membrane receptor protein involved in Fe transport
MTDDMNGVVASLNNLSDEGTYSLRGLTTFNNFYLRNGFYRQGMVDRVNTDRIEVIKGPNAALYGATNPAGMVNIVSKTPKPRALPLIPKHQVKKPTARTKPLLFLPWC